MSRATPMQKTIRGMRKWLSVRIAAGRDGRLIGVLTILAQRGGSDEDHCAGNFRIARRSGTGSRRIVCGCGRLERSKPVDRGSYVRRELEDVRNSFQDCALPAAQQTHSEAIPRSPLPVGEGCRANARLQPVQAVCRPFRGCRGNAYRVPDPVWLERDRIFPEVCTN